MDIFYFDAIVGDFWLQEKAAGNECGAECL